MSRITLDNYEAFLLDMAEGTISPADREALLLFLAANPEQEVDLDGIAYATTDADLISFENKESLKKTAEDPTRFEVLAVKQLEEGLTIDEEAELQHLLALNAPLAAELKAYGYTKLQPDTTIIFANKNALKQGAVIRPLYYSLAAAASVAVLVGAFVFLNQPQSQTSGYAAAKNTGVPALNIQANAANPVVAPEQKQNTVQPNTFVADNTPKQPVNNAPVITEPQKLELVAVNVIPSEVLEMPALENETAMGVPVPMPYIETPVLEEDKPGLLGGIWASAKGLIKKSVKDDEMAARIDTVEERGFKWDDLAFFTTKGFEKLKVKKPNIGVSSNKNDGSASLNLGRYTIVKHKKDKN